MVIKHKIITFKIKPVKETKKVKKKK